jgi:LacI family repressor for deo operon, udp, cdd, tsx, nupC, and nupG
MESFGLGASRTDEPMDASTTTTSRRDRSTIEDVALAAGVSVATVSRALRGLPNVAESTRVKVQQIAADLNYRADPAASRLATGRSKSVAVAVPLLNGWYFAHVVAGVEAVCAEAGYDTIVIGLGVKGTNLGLLDGSDALHRRADGLIVVDVSLSPEHVAGLRSRGLQLVSVGPVLDGIPSVGIDDIAVGELAAGHLLDLGHRRIALIRGELVDPYEFVVPHLRQQGFEAAHADRGLTPDHTLYADGSFTIEGGYDAATALLSRPERPTAIFALSDEMAFGAIHAARDLGLRIPEDVSIIGVDGHDAAPVVGLTTVQQDVEHHGARAARLMIAELNGEPVEAIRYNDPIRLVERASTARLG